MFLHVFSNIYAQPFTSLTLLTFVRRGEEYKSQSDFVQGHIIGDDQDDTVDLLVPARSTFLGQNSKGRSDARGMEVQLEAF